MDAYFWAPLLFHPAELLGKVTKYAKVEATKESKTTKVRISESSLVVTGRRNSKGIYKVFGDPTAWKAN